MLEKEERKMELSVRTTRILAVVLIIVAGISFFWLSGFMSQPETFDDTLAALDEKCETVTALTAGSTAASAAITLIPGDVGTPIADKLADLSGYFLIIMSALMIEKWLITAAGFVAFRIIIPICCLGIAAGIFFSRNQFSGMFVKLICFALLVTAMVPASVVLSNLIEDNYQATVQQTLQEAEQSSQAINEKAEKAKDQNALEKLVDKMAGGISGQIDKFKDILSHFIEAVAVLLVTTCAIPIGVMLFFFWLIKLMTGIDIKLPNFKMSEKARAFKSGI